MAATIRDVVFEQYYSKMFHQQAYLSYMQGRNQGWNEVLSVVHVMVANGQDITAESVAMALQEALVSSNQMAAEDAINPSDDSTAKTARKNHLRVVSGTDSSEPQV